MTARDEFLGQLEAIGMDARYIADNGSPEAERASYLCREARAYLDAGRGGMAQEFIRRALSALDAAGGAA